MLILSIKKLYGGVSYGQKIKLDFGEFVRFLDERKNGYYDFYRTALIKMIKKSMVRHTN